MSLLAFTQQPTPPKPQTPRQALIEIVTKGGDALQRHLTVEVQDLVKPQSKEPGLEMLNGLRAIGGLQSFETGDVLFVYEVPSQHAKYEVHVDSDDLAGDEDSLSLSMHFFRDGKEQDQGWSLMSSHFTVSMKLQQNIWRLDKVAIGAELPIGDPKFFEKTFLRKDTGEAFGVGLASVGGGSQTSETPAPAKPPGETVQMLAFAESAYARQHPETGFTCSLSELAQWTPLMGVDPQVLTGTYNGYRFAMGGCEGRPAGSFQITAEPLVPKPGMKAFCTDATQNLRVDETGRGAACLASGKVENTQTDDGASINWAVSTPSQPKN